MRPMTKGEILRQWNTAAKYLLRDLSATRIPAPEVRKFMLNWLNSPQERNNTVNCQYWQPLTDDQKQAAVAEVFPDGDYGDPSKDEGSD